MANSETVRVIVRCRPMNQREIDLNCQVRSMSSLGSCVGRKTTDSVLDDYFDEYENQSSLIREY